MGGPLEMTSAVFIFEEPAGIGWTWSSSVSRGIQDFIKEHSS